jgi:hypothetical protein
MSRSPHRPLQFSRRLDLLRELRPAPRKERTPYYFTGLPASLSAYILTEHTTFLTTFGRDYADEDPQFFTTDHTGLRPRPIEAPTTGYWLDRMATAMRQSNHHPAHIYAMQKTRKVIFGCGDAACFDLDECPRCNFRSVPEGWTKAWEAATREHEKWYTGLDTSLADQGLVKPYRR